MRLAVAWDVGDGGWDLGPAGPTPISPSDADTVAVGAPSGQVPSVAMSAVTQLDKPAEGSDTGSGVGDFTPMHFQMTDLSMAQYDVLYQQWVQGHMTLQQVEEDHWRAVREMMELQKVAEEGGMESQLW